MQKLTLALAVSVFAMCVFSACTKDQSNGDYTGLPSPLVADSVLHSNVWRMVYMYDTAGERRAPGSSLIERCWLRFLPDGTLQGYGASTRIDGSYTRNGNCFEISIPFLSQSIEFEPDPFCDYLATMQHMLITKQGELLLQCRNGGGKMCFVAVPDNVLPGSWQWVETHGSIEGAGGTPRTAGFHVSAHFADSLLIVLKNADTLVSTPYRVQNAHVSDCLNAPAGALLRALLVDIEASNSIANATNALVTIPYEGIVNFEMDSVGHIYMNLRENSCAGFMYRFQKLRYPRLQSDSSRCR